QFAFRSLKDVGVCNAPPKASNVQLSDKPTEEVKALKYSPNGKYLAWAISSQARVVDAQTQAVVSTIAHPGILDVQFSPSGTYLMTWERYSKSEHAEGSHNLKVWESATGELKGTFVQKAYTDWALQWTDDEKFCAKLFSGEVRFYAPTALQKAALTLKLDGITAFSVSPGLSPSVAVFVPERGGKPALVRMYTVGGFARPVANKTFFKADKVEFYWHKLGTNLLVLTQTEVDKTGRSYYGESSLYFMAAAGNFDCRVVLDREGPIHDVAWNPVEKEFVVTYGFMPAKTALFDHRAELVFDFGIAPRNFVRFNPHGRVLAVAGFGNLSGQVDLWDRKKLKKIGAIDAHGASFCEWGPDGRYLMAATLSPRLRVDNGIRVWHYSTSLVYHQEISELYQVDWRPAPVARYPQRSALSPVPAGITIAEPSPKASVKPAGAYRPPHARNR
ncbi:eIF2A-domain-containing protein, partial [Martensiomyces pterosporus]